MKPIRYLIFDLDGTLIDSSEGIVEAVNYSLRVMGGPEQSPERIRRYIGFPLSQMYNDFTDLPAAELYRHFRVKAEESVVASTVILPGVESTLKQLQQLGCRMAIATTKVRSNLDGIMAKFGWGSVFKVTIGGDEVERIKPEPDIFRLALKRMGAEPKEALVIGDTINDVLAARAVPMPVMAVKSPYAPPTQVLSLRPDYFLESIAELPAWLQGRQERSQLSS